MMCVKGRQMKTTVKWAALVAAALTLGGCHPSAPLKVKPLTVATMNDPAPENRKALTKFLKTQMVHAGGIDTNYQDTKQRQVAIATGHEWLSESTGIWLQYLALTRQFAAFDRAYRAAQKTFGQAGMFAYRFDPRDQRRFPVNATLDDLRIIRALLTADHLSGSDRYLKAVQAHVSALVKGPLKAGELRDYYDPQLKKAATTSSLAYYDLEVLQQITPKWAAKQLQVVQQGFLGAHFPLYAAAYDWQTKQYSRQSLNTSEALETLLHLAQVGKLKASSRQWLQTRVTNGDLVNRYAVSGRAMTQAQSPGSYALAAQIFALLKDKEHYSQAMALVWAAQIHAKGSPMNGAIGLLSTKQADSYTNLTALIAAQ